MSSTVRIDYVEQALIALLNAGMPAAYAAALPAGSPQIQNGVAPIDIQALGDKDFDDDGRLVLQPPSIRVRYHGSKYGTLRDSLRLTYQGTHLFELLCFESSLRSRADERKQTLILVSVVQDQCAGARLSLADSSKTMPMTLKGVSLQETDEGPVDQLFSVVFDVEGIAQYSGVNAEFGG